MATTPKAPLAAAASTEAPAEAKSVTFESVHGGLIVYHEAAKIAEFAAGRFTTDDPKIIAALRDHELVTVALL